VDVYPSLVSAQGDIEAVDANNGAYKLFTDEGRVIEARSGGRFSQNVRLQVTEICHRDDLVRRPRDALSQVPSASGWGQLRPQQFHGGSGPVGLPGPFRMACAKSVQPTEFTSVLRRHVARDGLVMLP